ncbi:MAG: polysaccharide biosynthesis/export family protein [Chthoniobacteraceae bacterium]|jgi:protein involved in polysaccharide export with SLBB domain
MISRICARLILVAGLTGLAQVQAGAQANIDAAQSQFGTQPAPYAQTPQPTDTERGVPVAQPVQGAYAPAGAYAPPATSYGYAPQDVGSLGAPDPTKPLGRGDIVTFSIAQDREPPTVMRVTDTGELDFSIFPKIGRISVVGRTCADVAAELKRKLEADYYNAADVTLGINQVNYLNSRGKVYITGNVPAPGPQDLPSNERTMVSTAIIRAGGLGKFADGHKVEVTRQDKNGKTIRFKVDVASIIDQGRRDRDVELEDGDYINVPQKLINF